MRFGQQSVIAVVGGSIAAVTAADALRLEGFEGSLVVVSDEGSAPYTRIPLSKSVLAGRELPESTDLPSLGDDIDLLLEARATGLQTRSRIVRTTAGDIRYDGLVIATGARARLLGEPETQEFVLRSRSDCLRLAAALEAARSVLVVGGGFLGMEIASTCVSLGREVTVIDREPALQRLLGEQLSEHVRSVARDHGVRLVVDPSGVQLVPGSDGPSGVRLGDGQRIEADLVVTAAGDVPNVEWLAGSDLELAGGVVVDPRCFAAPGVVAAGDVACTAGPDGSLRGLPNWTNAVDQARAAARALLLGDAAPIHTAVPYTFTEQFGLDIKLVGNPPPVGQASILEGDLAAGSALIAWTGSQSGPGPSHVAAVNHALAPARLKRMVR